MDIPSGPQFLGSQRVSHNWVITHVPVVVSHYGFRCISITTNDAAHLFKWLLVIHIFSWLKVCSNIFPILTRSFVFLLFSYWYILDISFLSKKSFLSNICLTDTISHSVPCVFIFISIDFWRTNIFNISFVNFSLSCIPQIFIYHDVTEIYLRILSESQVSHFGVYYSPSSSSFFFFCC